MDKTTIPTLLVDIQDARLVPLDARARWVLAFVDGTRAVEEIFEENGLPEADAAFAMAELVAKRLVALESAADS